MDRETLSIMKACEVVGVSRRTIYNWISAGKVEYVRTAGGSIRIFADTLWRPSTSAQTQLGVSRVEGRAAAPDERPGHGSRTPAGPHA
jgi:excisionase family DNA binding protein